tara:strand:- start:246 stop:482 length:237 start_codon:yes stop_codon:yes gene_type:complete
MSGKQVAQYRFGDRVINVEEYNIAGQRCWEFRSPDGVDVSCHANRMLDQRNISYYQQFEPSDLSDVPTQDTVKQWCHI